MISYAQNHEDVLLWRLFREQKTGFYVDVGAALPVGHSVTKWFYDNGWHGINIEPVAGMYDLLCADRTRDVNLRVAVSNFKGGLPFAEVPASAGRATCDNVAAEKMRQSGMTLSWRDTLTTTLADICAAHVRQPIDFLKIDVEGHEREVIEGADWQRWRPRVVVVEATEPGTSIPNHESWEPIVLKSGYRFAVFDGLNRYYVSEEERHLICRLSVPVNVFDDYVPHSEYCLSKAVEMLSAVKVPPSAWYKRFVRRLVRWRPA